MFVRNGQMLGSGVPRDKRGIPAPAERTTVPVSPDVARSIKKARSKPAEESAKPKPVQEPVQEQEPVLTETEQEADLQATQSRADEPDEVEGPPKDYAPKGDWVDYAISRGADRDEAESLTKAELIDLYGGD